MSSIQWTDETWNPTVGCSRVSPGCENCYAERVAARELQAAHKGLTRKGSRGPRQKGSRGPRWTGEVRLLPERLETPIHWRKPRRVFVDSMSDLFHPRVPTAFIDRVFAVMALTPQHTYQVLTKRPERMLEWASRTYLPGAIWDAHILAGGLAQRSVAESIAWPLPNVWLGTSAENQETLDERVPSLLRTPAAVRFLSVEPLLSRVELRWIAEPDETRDGVIDCLSGRNWIDDQLFGNATRMDRFGDAFPGTLVVHRVDVGEQGPSVDWVIVGGESGPGARPCDVDWIRSVLQQCRQAGVPCFVKQLGAKPYEGHSDLDRCCDRAQDHPGRHPLGFEGPDGITRPLRNLKGGDPAEWPEDLRVREWPDRKGTA